MTQTRRLHCISLAVIALAGILVLMPFHALITVWAASATGHYDILRLWKEALLLLLIPITVWIVWNRPQVRRELDTRWLFWASVCYVLLHLGLGALALAKGQVNLYALLYALVVNLRFLVMFWACLIVSTQSPWLKRHWRQLLLWPAALVVAFGLLQFFVLPAGVLQHAGYGQGTIAPFETVDQKLQYVRVQSTLRGPNPLGAYLVIIVVALVISLLGRYRTIRNRSVYAVFTLAALVVLVATYSRSAYLGTVLAVGSLVFWMAHRARAKRWLVIGLVAACLLGGASLGALRHNDRFENTFFHTDEHSLSLESSNQSRAAAMRQALSDVLHEPFGRGPGTAGPASAHNQAPARIAENYYLQIGQEVGWLGLALFVTINTLVVIKLWRLRHDALARTLLASFVGISVINLMSHAWADDTLSLLWWGLAGVAVAPAILPLRVKS